MCQRCLRTSKSKSVRMTMAPLALACVASGGSLGWPAVEMFLAHAALQPASLNIFNPQDASLSSRPAPGSAAAGLACVGPSRVHNREVFAAFAAALAPGASLFVHGAVGGYVQACMAPLLCNVHCVSRGFMQHVSATLRRQQQAVRRSARTCCSVASPTCRLQQALGWSW